MTLGIILEIVAGAILCLVIIGIIIFSTFIWE